LKVKDVAVGDKHMCAITEDGAVWTWGYNGCSGLFGRFFTSTGPLGGVYSSD